MSSRQPGPTPTAMPWADRGDAGRAAGRSPRSQRDLEILRSLARRINPQDAGAHNNIGVVFYNKGLYDDAVRHFERALEIDPRMQVAERNLQIAYFGTGHFEQLSAELRERVDADGSDAEARDQLARMYYNSGNVEEAVVQLRELLALRPRDGMLYQRLARAELKRGDLDAALVALRNAQALDGTNARVHFMLGEVLYQRGLSGDAREPLERAIELDGTLADAFHLLAFVYGDLGETDRATRTATRAAQLNPSYAKAEAGLSLDSYSTARYEELIGERGRETPSVAAGGELAHYNLGLAFRQKALYDEALREFRLATERGEDTFLVQQAQAEMLLLRGDTAESIELYHDLIRQESASPKLWNELGVAQHQMGALAEAEQSYLRSLEIDPNYALAWNNLAVVRHHRGTGDAEAAFRAALQEGRAEGDACRNFALMLHRTGRPEQSAEAYERALEADPSNAHAATGYGILLLERGDAAQARAQLIRAVELAPDLPEARYHLAFALSALGDYAGALRETKHALDLDPYIPTPRFRLLIDLQFEEASVLAPELDVTERVEGGEVIASFNFQPAALDAVFAADTKPAPAAAGEVPGAEQLDAARLSMDRGMLEQASAEAQRAALSGARRVDVLLLQGEIFLRRGLSGEAVDRFNDALGEISRNGSGVDDNALRLALHGAARSLLDLGRMGEAVEAAERLCELAPGDVEALRTLGGALSRVSDFARAAIVLEQARLQVPDDVHLLTELGAAYAAAGDAEGAEQALRRAVANDAMAVAARTTLARVLADDGRHHEAETEYRAALRSLPSYGDAAFGLTDVLAAHGRERDAIGVMVDLLTMDPYRADALVRLGELLARSGRSGDAERAFRRALRFDPDAAAARSGLVSLGLDV
jgi:tetratricopeptide (TPR) repeat protein